MITREVVKTAVISFPSDGIQDPVVIPSMNRINALDARRYIRSRITYQKNGFSLWVFLQEVMNVYGVYWILIDYPFSTLGVLLGRSIACE